MLVETVKHEIEIETPPLTYLSRHQRVLSGSFSFQFYHLASLDNLSYWQAKCKPEIYFVSSLSLILLKPSYATESISTIGTFILLLFRCKVHN